MRQCSSELPRESRLHFVAELLMSVSALQTHSWEVTKVQSSARTVPIF